MLDSAILFLLGIALIFAPQRILLVFQLQLPPAAFYLVGLWGCVFVTLAWGYAVAATNPLKHIVWIQVGIARGILETIVAVAYVLQGFVTFGQASFGIVVALLVTISYLALYPRKSNLAAYIAPNPAAAQK